MAWKQVLTSDHFRGLKDHKYKAEGISIIEVFLQPIWRRIVEFVPLWVAPNALTFSGLTVNVVSALLVVLMDLKAEGKSPWWAYLFCAFGLLIYQVLDAIDGKQARRTGTNNQLGEIFDHGCDAISTFCVAISGVSAAAMSEYPYMMLAFVMCIEILNYIYHWQTYVSGVLYFKKIDCTEAQFCYMGVMLTAVIFGTEVWNELMPWFGWPLKYFLLLGIFLPSLINTISAFVIIFTEGKGKNGSTVADTSVLSPIIPVALLCVPPIYSAVYSSGRMLENHPILFLTAMTGPFIKLVLHVMMAAICKTPLPFFDSVMIGPLAVTINVFCGCVLPEYYVLSIALVYFLYDIISYCVGVVLDVCNYLGVSCFTIPYPPPSKRPTPMNPPQQTDGSSSTVPGTPGKSSLID